MKDLVDREPVLNAFKERTRRHLGGRRLDIMDKADLDGLTETVVISSEVVTPGPDASTAGSRSRSARAASRK